MGIGIFVSFIWGIIFFKEVLTSILIGTVGIFLLIFGISLISSTTEERKNSNFKGIIFAIITGIIAGSYLVPLKISNLQPTDFIFSMSLGILIGGFTIYLLKRSEIDKKIILPGAISGVVWNIANLASFFAVLNLGISVGFPLTQMALFISVLWGLFYFHEIKNKSKIIRLFLGAIILFVGAVSLVLSM
jgi:glucose uptake protein